MFLERAAGIFNFAGNREGTYVTTIFKYPQGSQLMTVHFFCCNFLLLQAKLNEACLVTPE
jgi:hypothetical protein